MKTETRRICVIMAALVLTSCADHEEVASVDVKPPLVLANSLAYLQASASRVVVVDRCARAGS